LAQNRACEFDFAQEQYSKVDGLAFDLMKKMLDRNPQLRISAQKAI
jgi:hypothetical protein